MLNQMKECKLYIDISSNGAIGIQINNTNTLYGMSFIIF